ncbi:hypothetical protein ACQPZP_05275 [Spirillospora sp. CA-142024]|uniref:hypothetical protein n=1 Tax=Spirillospora sp. CA-142024 TaxID=3240036 RepID=UPI003D944F2F
MVNRHPSRSDYGRVSRTHQFNKVPTWRRLLGSWLTWFGVLATAAATAAVVGVVQRGTDKVTTPSKAAKIEVIDMLVDTPKDADSRPVSLDIKLHNTGTRRSIIKRAVLSIHKFTMFKECAGQGGGLGVSATYGLNMPVRPKPGQKVEVPLSQQLGPDEADRFKIELNLPQSSAWIENPDQGKLFVYQVGVTLIRDTNSKAVNLGDAVVALPITITVHEQQFFLTKENAEIHYYDWLSGGPEAGAGIRQCLRANNVTLRQYMTAAGAKPKWFSELSSELVS